MTSKIELHPIQSKLNDKLYLSKQFKPSYTYNLPGPTQIDQFAPLLTKKMKKNRSYILKSSSECYKSNLSDHKLSRIARQPNKTSNFHENRIDIINDQTDGPSNNFGDHILCETVFDNIAVGSLDMPLGTLVEKNMQEYFKAERVHFFHDIQSISTLYCPSSGVSVPYRCGLVGFCHFSKRTLMLNEAESHVSYNQLYDGRLCDPSSFILVFPIFNSLNQVIAVIELVRHSSTLPFNDADLNATEYFQEKFKMYSRWIFQYYVTDEIYSDFCKCERTGPFVDKILAKLSKYFSCRSSEIWEYHIRTNEIYQLIPQRRDPQFVQIQDAGIVAYSLTRNVTVSIEKCQNHSCFNPKTDTADQSVLVLPIVDPENPIVYGICLRGKRIPGFFTDTDEKLLYKISPLILTSLTSSRALENTHRNIENMYTIQSRLESIISVAQAISGKLRINELVPTIMSRACTLIGADRCSLFMVNDKKDKLVTSYHDGLAHSIEMPINLGIVGHCATSAKILNIKDAYEDPRFSKDTDLKTGYKTNTILCVPIFDEDGNVRGVTEMINKKEGVFSSDDETTLQVFNMFAQISLENARLFNASLELTMQLRSILDISQNIVHNSKMKVVIEKILSDSRKIISAGRAMVYLINPESKKIEVFASSENSEAHELRSQHKTQEQKESHKKTLLRQILAGPDADTEDRVDDDEERSAYVRESIHKKKGVNYSDPNDPTMSLICCPIFKNNGKRSNIVGVLLMQWKTKSDGFTDGDLRMLESFGIFISLALDKTKSEAAGIEEEPEYRVDELFNERELEECTPINLLLLPNFSHEYYMYPPDINELDTLKLLYAIFDSTSSRSDFNIRNGRLFNFISEVKQKTSQMDFQIILDNLQYACYLVNSISIPAIDSIPIFIALLCSRLTLCAPSHLLFNINSVMRHKCALAMEIVSRTGVIESDSVLYQKFVKLMCGTESSNTSMIYELSSISLATRTIDIQSKWRTLYSELDKDIEMLDSLKEKVVLGFPKLARLL